MNIIEVKFTPWYITRYKMWSTEEKIIESKITNLARISPA